MNIASVEDMRAMEYWACEETGIPELLLMENAGRAVADACMEYLTVRNNQVVVVCGKGANAGDGLVAARHLRQRGVDVRLFLLNDPKEFTKASAENWSYIECSGFRWYTLKDENSFYPLKLCIETADCIVDAICGIGFKGELKDNYSLCTRAINNARVPVISVDVPTGVDAQSGLVCENVIKATKTITFFCAKLGLCLYPGREYSGKVEIADISIPDKARELIENPITFIDEKWACKEMPKVVVDSYKGTYGHVLGIAGSRGMVGAAILSARGALRTGAGLVSVMIDDYLADNFDFAIPECLTIPIESYNGITEMAEKYDAIYIGPGINHREDLTNLIRGIITTVSCPVILDAGALWAIERDKDMVSDKTCPLILTPHVGEIANLIGVNTIDILADRIKSASVAAKIYDATVVLKGASSIIADSSGSIFINSSGNAVLSAAATGDVLAGVIAALCAQKVAPTKAAILGTYIHGLAGDLKAYEMGQRGVLASEIADAIPVTMKKLRLENN